MGRRALTGLLASALALCLGVGAAPASASDASATHAYLQANYTLLRTAHAHLRAGEAAPRKLLATLRRECPGAARGSPQDRNSTQLSNEVIGAMVISAYRLDLPAIRRFVAATSGLRWSNGRLTRAVHAYAGNLRVLVGLGPPAVCADVRAWAASSFRALAPSTVSFDARFMPNWVALGLLPGQLARYTSAQDRAVTRRSSAIESEIADAEARAVETWGAIIDMLGVWP